MCAWVRERLVAEPSTCTGGCAPTVSTGDVAARNSGGQRAPTTAQDVGSESTDTRRLDKPFCLGGTPAADGRRARVRL